MMHIVVDRSGSWSAGIWTVKCAVRNTDGAQKYCEKSADQQQRVLIYRSLSCRGMREGVRSCSSERAGAPV